VYKLTFAAAFGLLATGAIVQRYARRDDENRRAQGDNVDAALRDAGMITEGAQDFSAPADQRAKAEIRERP
jgi:hypothetical protein